MKSASFLAATCLLTLTSAVDMGLYAPGSGVEPEFKNYLESLYHQTEIVEATTSFTSFFIRTPPGGTLIVRSITAIGDEQIIALKQRLLPLDGNKHWNHKPNTTTVYSDSKDKKVYEVLGAIQSRFDHFVLPDGSQVAGNCSMAYYTTRFTIAKNNEGVLDLTPGSGNLVIYDDLAIAPSQSPTNIPC